MYKRQRTGQLTDEEWQKYTIAQGNLANASIYIDDTPGIRITEIRSRSRKLAQETGDVYKRQQIKRDFLISSWTCPSSLIVLNSMI